MKASDVTDTLELALQASGCDQVNVHNRPRLLSDNGCSYTRQSWQIGSTARAWIMFVAHLTTHKLRARSPLSVCRQTPAGQRRRRHQTLKNRILLENYFLPGDLKGQVGRFISHYNHRRYHENLQNLTPADVYFGHGDQILQQRERIKRKTIELRRLQHQKQVA